MLLSSGCRDRGCDFVAPSVTDQGPDDVDASVGEGAHGLDVLLSLGAFAVVELPRVRVVADADECGGVEDALESSVVGGRPVEVAAYLARVAGCGGDSGEGRESVRGV